MQQTSISKSFTVPAQPPKPSSPYLDVTVTLLALLVMPLYLFGVRTLWHALTAVLAGLAAEYIGVRLCGEKRIPAGDFSWMVTALSTVMLMPVSAPLWITGVSVVLGLCIAKHPFGGTGKNIFNPAAVGVAFCAICWPGQVLHYPIPLTTQGISDPALYQYSGSIESFLRVNGTPQIDYFDILLGKFSGPMGATCMIVLGCCLFYLLLRKKVSPRVVFSMYLVIFLIAVFSPRLVSGRKASVIFEFASGGMVFGSIFMANDPATLPRTKGGQVYYGLLLGLLVMVLRHIGAMDLEIVYAILLANLFSTSCDRWSTMLRAGWKRMRQEPKLKVTIINADTAPAGDLPGKGGKPNA